MRSLIVAVARNHAIGKDNDLLWHLPNDMRYFKSRTVGHHIITGRKNYISIPEKYRPLSDRTNIVLTRNHGFQEAGCIVKHTLEDAINYAQQQQEAEVFIIGGGQIYHEALEKNLIDRMYITHVDGDFDADTFFPEIDNSKWKKTDEVLHPADEKHAFAYSFAVYEKMN
ncbi:MAG: dihydrofolate reductase [Flavobacteriales bacterium]|nr:dihydrofolate reductase [Flavobacteriales bacterium]